ncbi:hypothetical protein [Francisella hispaniensis]|uniref:hypothetical protein n=1 Tax=Francisella hispaniensis TaxID=622488 RepID=UPI0019058D23|nr:hypothetical protein [Francisella hispaniensis]MBK2357681.1 hypothetical protein [Francisella hispaniensis]
MLNDFFYVVSYLHDLDIAMEKLNRVYKRYVDYFIIMTKIKHKLWKTIKIVKHILNKLILAEHLDNITEENNNPYAKTFEFLGVKICHTGIIDINDTTKNNFVIKINQLYEYYK